MEYLCGLFWLSVVSAVALPFMSSPYTLGSVFMVALSFVTVFFMAMGATWYMASMFLIYAGALLVLFMYMACLSPNVRVKPSRWGLLMLSLLGVGLIIWLGFTDFSVTQSVLNSSAISEAMGECGSPVKLSSRSKGDLLMFSGAVLFFSLVSVVKICNHQKGALRPFKRSRQWTTKR